MAKEQGFRDCSLKRVGRIPPIAASMVAVFSLEERADTDVPA
jgi:hypothetical protein